jgi:tetratricopeptide (TPR) repeat protein
VPDNVDVGNAVGHVRDSEVVQANMIDGGVYHSTVRPAQSATQPIYHAGRDQLFVNGTLATVQGAPVAHSAYLEQVQRIAPPELKDRDPELVELARFCTQPDGASYAAWRGPAWAGKSALMAWFVLHPPPDVRVISFFVTARYAAQSDRVAFADVLLEQLAELLNRPIPGYLTDATRDCHLLHLLTDAATACAQAGSRLVLVVDGLDEDSGVYAGSDGHSIAALLPGQPVGGMRIVVSGRPDPPVPEDVPGDHPLRDASIVRELRPSPHAVVVKTDAQRELKRLLRGTTVQRDLLGLVTAAGGGLSGPDLAELTGCLGWQVEEHLHAVSGRTFSRRVNRWQPGIGPEVYVLGHEELRTAAAEYLGRRRLADYRRRLHEWCDHVRAVGWPPGTSEYLLRGYFRLLQDTGDTARMVACATDDLRHDRMLDITGGDAAALAEILAAQEAVANRAVPDLLAVMRLAMHRDTLAQRNVNIPILLPAAWTALGNVNRAKALARSITNAYDQARALIHLVEALAQAGDPRRARMLTDEAETLTRSIDDRSFRAQALSHLAHATARTGDIERAEVIAHTIPDADLRARALADLVRGIADQGALDRAESLARSVNEPMRALIMSDLVRALVRTGQLDRANALTQDISDPEFRARAQIHVVSAVAGTDLGRGESLARCVAESYPRFRALIYVLDAAIAAEDEARQGNLIAELHRRLETIADPLSRSRAMTHLIRSVAAAGDRERAAELVTEARALARGIASPLARAEALTDLVPAIGATGDVSSAELLATTITDQSLRAEATAELVEVVARSGQIDRAETLARSIHGPRGQTTALNALARTVVAAGQLTRAETLARSIDDGYARAQALSDLVGALAGMGAVMQAETVAGSIDDPDWRTQALTCLVRAVVGWGDTEHLRTLARQAEKSALAIGEPSQRARMLTDLLAELVAAGEPDRARELAAQAEAAARSIIAPDQRARLLTALVRAVAATGDLTRAEALTTVIDAPNWRVRALVELIQVVPTSADPDQLAELAVRVEQLVKSMPDAQAQAQSLMELADAVATAGRLDQAEKLARSIIEEEPQTQALVNLVRASAKAGEIDRAEALVRSIGSAFAQVQALTGLIQAVAATGDAWRAERLLGLVSTPDWQAHLLSHLVLAVAESGDLALARRLAVRARATVHAISAPDTRARALSTLVHALARAGEIDQAENLARATSPRTPHSRVYLVEGAARAGELDRAELIAYSITSPIFCARALIRLVCAMSDDAGRVQRLAADAESMAQAITEPGRRAQTLGELATALGRAGEIDRAEVLARSIGDPDEQARALTTLAACAPARARRLLARAFLVGDWTIPLPALVPGERAVLTELADDALRRHQRCAPDDSGDSGVEDRD